MYYYRIAGMVLESCYQLLSFTAFECAAQEPDVVLESTKDKPENGEEQHSGSIAFRKVPEGWFIHPYDDDQKGVYTNKDYTHLKILGARDPLDNRIAEWHIRIALECWLTRHGFVSLHAAAVEAGGEAYAFSGPSGVGKSTRANAWTNAINAKLINGDRPLINVHDLVLHGVPWDGKEQCFRNVYYPLRAICEVRRSRSVYVRQMSFAQRRKLLLRQCFMPMWDTETAMMQMANISRLAATADMVRVFCGPDTEDVQALYSAIKKHQYIKEEPDMKAKPGFVLRNVVDEYILMPTGDNIGKFNGTVLLNEVSALVWEKLQNPVSKDDLLKAILDEFEVERAVASADLDMLLDTLHGYGVIEED